MKKYVFPLRSVQTVREIRELKAREAFSAAVHEVSKAEEALRQVRGHIEQLEISMRLGRGARVQPAEQLIFIREYEYQREREKASEQTLEKMRMVLAKMRAAWVIARRNVRVIEKLETKARQAYRREFDRDEQAQLDERSNALAGRPPLLMS
jgi:flagellar FliJ protein